MMNMKLLGFLFKSVIMGMIAALFLFTFFPHLMSPITELNKPAVATVEVLSFADAIQKTSPSVVNIRTFVPEVQKNSNQPTAQIGMGSGVIISAQGYIATNYHVISKAVEIAVELTDGRQAIAKVIGFDVETDLAVLKISLDDLPAITLTPDVTVQVGDISLVIGNPFSDIFKVRIVFFKLFGGIENPEIRRRVTTGSRHPLPVTYVLSQVEIQEFFGKIGFAPTPIY